MLEHFKTELEAEKQKAIDAIRNNSFDFALLKIKSCIEFKCKVDLLLTTNKEN